MDQFRREDHQGRPGNRGSGVFSWPATAASFISPRIFAEPLRTALLIHEARNKFGKTLRVEVGDPIPWDAMQSLNGRQELTDFLYRRVQSLARARENEPGNGSARSRAAG